MWLRVATWASAAVLSVAAAALAWSAGVLTAGDTSDPDYFWQPIDSLVDLKYLVLAVALVVGGACVMALVRLRQRGTPIALDVIGPLLLIAVIIGGSYSVMTAPVVGANLGAGLAMFAAPIAIVAIVMWSGRSVRARHASSAADIA